MKILGVTLILLDIVISSILIFYSQVPNTRIVSFALIFLLGSTIIMLTERIVSIRFRNLKIETVAEKARIDAEKIEKIYTEVNAQKEALDLIVRDANTTQKELLKMKDLTEDVYLRLLHTEQIAKVAETIAKKSKEEAVDEVFKNLVKALR